VTDTFQTRLRTIARETEARLDSLLSDGVRPGEIARPERLMAAMRHAALAGGKRLRPFLLVESAALFGKSGPAAIDAAAALECLHCYSLAHDDLPAMDDDDLRRGRPTVHKAFDEATAILAGDALLTLAFEIVARLDAPAEIRVTLAALLGRAAGPAGMVGGQMLDLAAEGRVLTVDDIRLMQSMKTGALIRYACEAGAVIGEANDAHRERLVAFGKLIGEAFQLADDLIDATGDATTAGKATAKDAARGKATLVGLYGVDEARRRLDRMTGEAVALIEFFGERGAVLAEAARFIASRES